MLILEKVYSKIDLDEGLKYVILKSTDKIMEGFS